MNCYDESRLEKNLTEFSSNRIIDLSQKVRPKTSLINFNGLFSSTNSFNYFVQIKLISLFQSISNIYRAFLFYSIKIYYSLINYIFRSTFFDPFNATGYSNTVNDKTTNSNERVFHNYKITEVANYLRFNPFILEGYRSNLNFKQCLLSLFYLHNESTNIYSHGKVLFNDLFFLIFVFRIQFISIYSNIISK